MKLLLGLVVLALACASVFGEDHIVNTKVLRTIDITTQFARHTLSITAENKGSRTTSVYLFAVQNASHLAFINAEIETGELTISGPEVDPNNDHATYKLSLPLEAGKNQAFKVSVTFTGALEPFPQQIAQGDRQRVRYYDNAYFFSPYVTAHQRTTIKLATGNVLSHSQTAPTKVSGDTLTYGAYENVKPHSHSLLWVHFENNSPFLTVSKMTKEYEVSHWGNLAVEQHVDVRHAGASLKGQFSRFDFQRNPSSTPSAVLQLTEILPLEAADVYYRDDIGNISTSSFSVSARGLEFHIVPRFPLFGGWKNNWYTGYNLPLSNYLSTDGSSTYLLNVSFASDFGNLYIEDYTLKVILPEGAHVTRVTVPFAVDIQEAKHFTYLDTTGRPVLSISKRNIVPEHNVYLQVEYTFSSLTKWFEPLLIAGAFFVLLAGVMVYVRFQLSIKPVDSTKTFQKRDEIIVTLKGIVARVDSEFARQNAIADKSTEANFKWTEKPEVLNELQKVSTQATPLTTGESFSARMREFYEAEVSRFKYQGKLHTLRLAQGSQKTKSDKVKNVQEKLESANDIIQQFKEDWIA